MKLISGLIITIFISTTLSAMDNGMHKQEKEKLDKIQSNQPAQNNSNNLLARTTGITITGIQNLIAQYAKEWSDVKELKENRF